jgi:sugar/nucleoside kinase (ribokinase family)
MKVNVVGSSLVDLSFDLPRQFVHRSAQAAKIELPFGEKLSTEGYTLGPGGSGANLSVGLMKAGFSVWLHTGLAKDAFGAYLRELLARYPKLTLEAGDAGAQTTLSVILRLGGERTIISARSSSSSLPKALPKEGWIHIGSLYGSFDEFAVRLLEHQVKTGQEISLNPSIGTLEERSRALITLLRTTSVIVLNRLEALRLTRLMHRTSPEALLLEVAKLGPKVVCITDGEHGAYVRGEGLNLFGPALRSRGDRVDATGAGDSFTAGFLASYLSYRQDLSPPELLRRSLACGIANSAAVVSAVGAHEGLLNLEQMSRDASHVKVRSLL